MLRSTPFLSAIALLSLTSPTAASLIVTYELEGAWEVITPVGLDASPFSGTGETPTWSTGLFTNDLGQTNTSTVLNGVAIPGIPFDGMVSYPTPAEVTTNSISLFFPDADGSLGLAGIGEGIVEIMSLDFFYRVRTDPALDSVISVQGLSDFAFAGGSGHLNAAGAVDSWTSDSVGLSHGEIMCTGPSLCGTVLLTPYELLLSHDPNAAFAIDLTGQFPASENVPASLGMTFSSDFQSLSFESGLPPAAQGSTDRSRLVFQGTVSAVIPEPSAALLVVCGLLGISARHRIH